MYPTHGEIEILEQLTAGRASFGGIGRVDKHELASSVCSFGDKSVAQVAPALIQDAFTKVSVAYHVGDLQIFEGDHIVGLRVGMCYFVEQVLALVLDMLLQTLQTHQRLATVFAASVFALHRALSNPQLGLRLAVVLGRLNPFSLTIGEQVFNVQIDPDLMPGWFESDRIGQFAAKANIPLARYPSNTCCLDLAFKRAMPENTHPADTEQLEPSSVDLNASTVLFETKTVEVLITLETWIARRLSSFYAPEECLVGFVYVVAHYLHRLAEHRLSFGERSAVADTRFLLLDFAHAALFVFPGHLALFDAHVVPVATRIQDLPQLFLLGRCWTQTVFEGFELHQTTNTLQQHF